MELFETGNSATLQPQGEYTCKECNQTKPLAAFYICGGRPQSRCKECKKAEADALKLYSAAVSLENYNDWGSDLQELAAYFSECRTNGGKINYKGSVATELADRYDLAREMELDPEKFNEILENFNPTEMIIWLKQTVDAIQKTVNEIMKQTNVWLQGEGQFLTAQGQQERKNLITKIKADPQMVEILGSQEDVDTFCAKLLDAARKVVSMGYLPGGELRQIVVEFESVQEPFTEDIMVFYRKFLLPGIKAAQLREDYEENKQLVESLLGLNYYEIDWSAVPSVE